MGDKFLGAKHDNSFSSYLRIDKAMYKVKQY